MGTVETQSKAPYGVSSPLAETAKVQGSKQEEKNELREEALGTLTSEEGHCGVPENGVGDQGLGDDGVVGVAESSVFETKVSVLSENGCQVLANSEVNGVSSLSKMRESGVLSCDGCEKLDCACASERRVAEAAVLSDNGLAEVGGEDTKDEKESEEGKKDENCDGKIDTIVEVPIMETSENMDVEVEDLRDERYGFSVGDFVWGKIKSHPWWPGRVYDPSDASDFALKLKQKSRLLVAYFGDGTFAWCHPSQLKPFEDNFDDMVRQSSSRAFTNAVQEAINEVGRLLDMKTSYSFVARETTSEFTPLLAKNSGIKEGVFVPEGGIERLSAVPIEPAALLSQVKQIAAIVDIPSILELEILKARLSALYLSRGGYKLPDYEDPQPVPELEDSLIDEAVDVGHRKSAVEAPVRGPFEEDYSTLPLSPKSGELCHSPGLSGSRLSHKRKQKSIAEIMGEDKDVHTKNREVVDAIGSSGRKKRKGSEDEMASKPIQKRKELLLSTDRNVMSAEDEGSRGKENSDKGTSLRSKKKKEAFGNENISSEIKKETDEGKTKEQNEKGSLSRERKKSKYLSPPFTTSIRGLMKENIETEFLKVSSEASPLLKCNGEAFQENSSSEVAIGWGLSDSSNNHAQDDENKTIDLEKIQVSSGEVLSKVRDAAVSPQIPRESTSLDKFVDFVFVLRSSLYREGSLYKIYKKHQPGRKRKKPESELGMLGKDQNPSDHVSPNHDSESTKRRKETTPSTPKGKRAPETKNGNKGTNEKASGAVLFVSFWPGSSLPSKSDLITMYSKFGALNEAETDMFRTNYTARVSFLRASDAEKALNHSQNMNPFESADATFQLQYPSAGSKSGKHSERSKKSKPSQDKKEKGKTPTTPSVSLSQGSEASKLNFIKHKLQVLNSMLESSDGKSPDLKAKIEREVKGLLEDVNKMVESTAS